MQGAIENDVNNSTPEDAVTIPPNTARILGLTPNPYTNKLVYNLLKVMEAARNERASHKNTPLDQSPPKKCRQFIQPVPPSSHTLYAASEPLVCTIAIIASMGSNNAFSALSVLRLVDRRFHSLVSSYFTTPHLTGLSRSRTIPFPYYAPMQLQKKWLSLNPGKDVPRVGWSTFRSVDNILVTKYGLKGSPDRLNKEDREFVSLAVDTH
jgi:hypothetical protein